ncbi:MAG: ATP-binding protein [Eubacterium sp.]|nr:ATP-binding protein [Eubacterium sp.]
MYIKRHLENQIIEASKYYPVVMVCGARQVGKSTMLNHLREDERRYVSLDDMNARRLAENDPALFFETYGLPIMIDEFQRVPSILLEIKRIVDQKALNGEKNEGLFWLTGSQKFKMMKNVSESLAGRIAVFDLSSLSTSEINGCSSELFKPDIDSVKKRLQSAKSMDIHCLYERIFQGGMPKINTSDIDRERYYSDYVNTYLERDIKELSQVGKLSEFYDFLVLMASRTSQQLKYSEIANSIGVSAPTAKEWVSILERSGIIYLLKPFYQNISKRLVKTPKIYFMDTGLAAYLCRWPNAETIENGAMDGAFLETYCVSEIVKSYYNSGKRPDLFYYRDVDGKEVDLLISEGNSIYPIEIKKSKNPASPDKNISALKKLKMEINPELVLCMTDEFIPYNRNVWLCPISVL